MSKKNLSIFYSNALRDEDLVTDRMRHKFRKQHGRDWTDFADIEGLGGHHTFEYTLKPRALDKNFVADLQKNEINSQLISSIDPRITDVVFITMPLTSDLYLRSFNQKKALNALARTTKDFLLKEEAADKYENIVIGWGGYTKLTTKHGLLTTDQSIWGDLFTTGVMNGVNVARPNQVNNTHGDTGTSSMILSSMKKSGASDEDCLIISGVHGPVGGAVLRKAFDKSHPFNLNFKKVVLITDGHKEGPRFDKISQLKNEVESYFNIKDRVILAEDVKTAFASCKEAKYFLCAGSADGMVPELFPAGTVIFDYSSPRGFRTSQGWVEKNILVLSAGYAEVADKGFSLLEGSLDKQEGWLDIGAHGDYSHWGCFAETISRAALSLKDNSIGQKIEIDEINRTYEIMTLAGFHETHPYSLDVRLSGWDEVKKFLSK